MRPLSVPRRSLTRDRGKSEAPTRLEIMAPLTLPPPISTVEMCSRWEASAQDLQRQSESHPLANDEAYHPSRIRTSTLLRDEEQSSNNTSSLSRHENGSVTALPRRRGRDSNGKRIVLEARPWKKMQEYPNRRWSLPAVLHKILRRHSRDASPSSDRKHSRSLGHVFSRTSHRRHTVHGDAELVPFYTCRDDSFRAAYEEREELECQSDAWNTSSATTSVTSSFPANSDRTGHITVRERSPDRATIDSTGALLVAGAGCDRPESHVASTGDATLSHDHDETTPRTTGGRASRWLSDLVCIRPSPVAALVLMISVPGSSLRRTTHR